MENTISLLRRLELPKEGVLDVVLDTDAYNEIDDQFAISYMIRSTERLNVRALYAAPFFNSNSTGPADGMERSYQEILHLLDLAGRSDLKEITFRGSDRYLPDENTPVESDAARHLAKLAMEYTPERPLYVVAIGAITNVASAILMEPAIRDRIVLVWLGGNALNWPKGAEEFNMIQDIAAARVVYSGIALVQLPCSGVVTEFAISGVELRAFLGGKNALCDYLVQHTCDEVATYCSDPIWTRVIWDVTAVGWLMGGLMSNRLIHAPIPEYDGYYAFSDNRHFMKYVYRIDRDLLLRDLVKKLTR